MGLKALETVVHIERLLYGLQDVFISLCLVLAQPVAQHELLVVPNGKTCHCYMSGFSYLHRFLQMKLSSDRF